MRSASSFAAQAVDAFATAFKEDFGEFHSFITGRDVFEIPEGEQFFAVGRDRRILRVLFAAFVFSANQRTLADPADFRLRRVEGLAFRIPAPDRFRPFRSVRSKNTSCVHSKASQLAISSRSGLRRIGVTPVKADVHFGHFLRWFVISRLMRDTSASASRSSASGALRAIIAKCRSYFSRSSLAIALNFGQVARSIVDLRGWDWDRNIPPAVVSECWMRRV